MTDEERVVAAVKRALSEKMDGSRYIDVSRIPLICQNIDGIHTTLKDMQKQLDNGFGPNGSISRLQNWRAFITGGIAVITLSLIPIIAIVIELYLRLH
jgi:hypothetical protein